MTQASFSEAIRSAIPDLEISDEPFSGPPPEGYVDVEFQLRPTSRGVRLSIRIGEDHPRRFTFSSEEEAATFIGQQYAGVQFLGASAPE